MSLGKLSSISELQLDNILKIIRVVLQYMLHVNSHSSAWCFVVGHRKGTREMIGVSEGDIESLCLRSKSDQAKLISPGLT